MCYSSMSYKLAWTWACVWMSQPRGVKPSLPYQEDPYLRFADFNTSGTFPKGSFEVLGMGMGMNGTAHSPWTPAPSSSAASPRRGPSWRGGQEREGAPGRGRLKSFGVKPLIRDTSEHPLPMLRAPNLPGRPAGVDGVEERRYPKPPG